MWFLPTYGRPSELARLKDAPGGLPPDLLLVFTVDDPALQDYKWVADILKRKYVVAPAGSRLCDIFNWVFDNHRNETCYGILNDDHWPLEPALWWEKMEEAAGAQYMAVSVGLRDTSPLGGTICLGGDLVRAMGYIAPPEFLHNYVDNVWAKIGDDFGLIRHVDEVKIQHKHWITGDAEKDATYHRGSDDIALDARTYHDWNRSDERRAMCKRIADMLGIQATAVDFKGMVLAVCTPMHDYKIEMIFEHSLQSSFRMFQEYGLRSHLIRVGGGSHPGKARERLLWNAMRTDATHFLFVDYDMGWDARVPMQLMASDHEFCAAVGVKKTDTLSFCCNFYGGVQEFHPRTNFLKVPDVGFGMVMLKRSVIEKMCKALPELEYKAGENGETEFALFLDMIDDDKMRLSEDLSFCRRWVTRCGGEIWIDPNIELRHAGRKEYTGRVSVLFQPAHQEPVAEAAE